MSIDTCNKSGVIKTVFILNLSDLVMKDGIIVRVKRKYGKFKRPILKKEFNVNS